jgi:hypothetical protein
MRQTLTVALLACLLGGCIGITITKPPPPPPEPRTPPRLEAGAAPVLEPTEIPGLLQAPSLVRLYYDETKEHWVRFAMNRWFMAFTWDGAWFPLAQDEIRPELRELHKPPSPKTRKLRLEELDRKLEELEEAEQEAGADSP